MKRLIILLTIVTCSCSDKKEQPEPIKEPDCYTCEIREGQWMTLAGNGKKYPNGFYGRVFDTCVYVSKDSLQKGSRFYDTINDNSNNGLRQRMWSAVCTLKTTK